MNLIVEGDKLNDIIVSGYTEKIDNIYYFRPMYWWLYLMINNKIIRLHADDGNILLQKIEKTDCEFDIEDEDFFTLTSLLHHNQDKVIQKITYNYDNHKNLVCIELNLQDVIIKLDALSFDGFKISSDVPL